MNFKQHIAFICLNAYGFEHGARFEIQFDVAAGRFPGIEYRLVGFVSETVIDRRRQLNRELGCYRNGILSGKRPETADEENRQAWEATAP